MEDKKKVNQVFSRIKVLSSIVWAVVILACAYQDFKDINIILISGFFIEFLALTSVSKDIQKITTDETPANT